MLVKESPEHHTLPPFFTSFEPPATDAVVSKKTDLVLGAICTCVLDSNDREEPWHLWLSRVFAALHRVSLLSGLKALSCEGASLAQHGRRGYGIALIFGNGLH